MKRARLGVFYRNMEGWIGGTYYIENLVAALHLLPDEEKPHIVVLCSTEKEFSRIEAIGYPYLSKKIFELPAKKNSLLQKVIRKISSITGITVSSKLSLDIPVLETEFFFPSPANLKSQQGQKKIFWIPDFQELYYPNFFSAYEVKERVRGHKLIASSNEKVIFSSHDVLKDFKKFYPQQSCKTFVIQFAVTHPSLGNIAIDEVKKKYGISGNYFMAPNQFWAHKNHDVIIDAAKMLLDINKLDFTIAFTGKEEDYRNPDYAKNLKNKVLNLGLEKNIKFLGFIDRADQLSLMKHAISVIQPSLFEGWSTVVEDTKALNQHIIASDLDVHKEQLAAYPHIMFARNDSKDLAEKILQMKNFCSQDINYDYDLNRKKFAREFQVNLLN
jgi:glycosyltransferase involved in cell wall biosynthesis